MKRLKRKAIKKQKLIKNIKSKQKWIEEKKLRMEPALLLQGRNSTDAGEAIVGDNYRFRVKTEIEIRCCF